MAATPNFGRALRRDARVRFIEFCVRFGEKETAADLLKKAVKC
jgi:hypothetical protein